MSRARASEQVLSVIPVAIWDSEIQQFDKPFRTVVPKVETSRGPAEGFAGGQCMHMKRINLISVLYNSQRLTQREYVRIIAFILSFTVAVSPRTI